MKMDNRAGLGAVLPKPTTDSFLPGLSTVRSDEPGWKIRTQSDGWEQVGRMLPHIPSAVGRIYRGRADLMSPILGENHTLLLHLQIQHPKITLLYIQVKNFANVLCCVISFMMLLLGFL